MRKPAVYVLALIMVLSLVAITNAAGSIEDQIRGQERRIHQGISKGSLTQSEAEMLLDNLNHIKERYNRALRDNMLTVSEQKRLREMLKQNSDMIYKKKHDMPRRLY